MHCGPLAGTMVGSPFTFIHLNYIPFLPNIYKRCWTSFSGCYIYKPKVKYCIREFRVVGNSWFPLSHSSPTFDSFLSSLPSPFFAFTPFAPKGPLPLYPFTFSPLLWYFIWFWPLWNNSVKSNWQTKVAKCWNPVSKDKNVLCLGFQYEVVSGDTNGIFYFLFSTSFQSRRKPSSCNLILRGNLMAQYAGWHETVLQKIAKSDKPWQLTIGKFHQQIFEYIWFVKSDFWQRSTSHCKANIKHWVQVQY